MGETCPACDQPVETTYACDDCGTAHCVDCRLPDAHDCQPAATDSESRSLAETTILGLTPLQWLAVPLVLALARAGSVGQPGGAYLAGQAFAAFLIVHAGVALVDRVRGPASEA